MTSAEPVQRSCPLCNKQFESGEAILRCQGCGVMHHPGCWVTNGGCATEAKHKVTPVAMAYATQAGAGQPAPHPGEGTRVSRPKEAPKKQEPIRFDPRPKVQRPGAEEPPPPEQGEGVIGGPEPEMRPRRYVSTTTDRTASVKPLPAVYRRNRILGLWYIPAAVLVVIAVAFGVVWIGDKVSGGGSSNTGAKAAATAGATASPAASGTAQASATASQTAVSTKFKQGQTATITGTGDCLNIRGGPSKTASVVSCMPDNTVVTIVDGPEAADGLIWWKVDTSNGTGWAAEDYLTPKAT